MIIGMRVARTEAAKGSELPSVRRISAAMRAASSASPGSGVRVTGVLWPSGPAVTSGLAWSLPLIGWQASGCRIACHRMHPWRSLHSRGLASSSPTLTERTLTALFQAADQAVFGLALVTLGRCPVLGGSGSPGEMSHPPRPPVVIRTGPPLTPGGLGGSLKSVSQPSKNHSLNNCVSAKLCRRKSG